MKKTVLFVMVAFLLVSSLAFISCGDNSGGGSNDFVGTWTTSQFTIQSDPGFCSATVNFTDSEWTLTVPSKNMIENGKYNITAISTAASAAKLTQNGLEIGIAISGTPMRFQLTLNNILYDGFFTKQQKP